MYDRLYQGRTAGVFLWAIINDHLNGFFGNLEAVPLLQCRGPGSQSCRRGRGI